MEHGGGRSSDEVVAEVRKRAYSGVRGLMMLNLASIPLSFATNMILGRASPEALGSYGAVQILIGTYYSFLVVGGANVFTRFVPSLREDRRFSFLASYSAVIGAIFLGAIVLPALLLPSGARRVLEEFGSPDPGVALGILAASLLWGLACYFLYAVQEPAWAGGAEKAVVLGFFVVAAAGLGPWRAGLLERPVAFVWTSALVIYALTALMAVWRVARTQAFRLRRREWFLPIGFWPVVGYTHFGNVVNYVYTSLSPSVVLVWVDLEALGFLHAAMRYPVLLSTIPATIISVLGPGLTRLADSGRRDETYRQASAGMRTSLLLLAPAAIVLALFAGDAMAVFGPEFRPKADLLRLLAPSILSSPVALCGAGVAVAIGAFSAYLWASLAYVVVAVSVTAVLVPFWGIEGAALAATLGALVRQGAILAVLRREGFPRAAGLATGWACVGGASAVAIVFDPPRWLAALMAIGFLLAFAFAARVRVAEVRLALRRALGRS